MRIVRALVLLLALVLATPAFAADLPTAKPAEVGLSSERLERLGQALRADVEKGRIPGAVVVIARRGPHRAGTGRRLPRSGGPRTHDARCNLPDRVDDEAHGHGRGALAVRGRPAGSR